VQKITDISQGIYIIEFYAACPFKILLKRFETIQFPDGYYYYIGSAQKNFTHRIKRHLKLSKKLHWHIDYLTTDKNIEIINVYMFKNAPRSFECELTTQLQNEFDLTHPVKGFGNSDCSICESHLLHSQNQIIYSQLLSLYQSAVRFIPSSRETF